MRTAILILLGALVLPGAATAQGGPRPLFGDLPPPAAPGPLPLPDGDEPLSAPPLIEATPLAAPSLALVGQAEAAAMLGGEPWPDGVAPPDLAAEITALPARIDEPTLYRVQRALLLAPGSPASGAEVFRARAAKLVAMGAVEDAAALMELVPAGLRGPAIEEQALAIDLAADRLDRACARRPSAGPESPVWALTGILCAAVDGERGRAELGLELAEERGRPAPPLFARLVRALGGEERVRLEAAPPTDPVLLPLLRRAPLEPTRAALREATPPVRRALAVNERVPAGLRPPIEDLGRRTAPAILPGLDGRLPPRWTEALAQVPEGSRALYLALAGTLGAAAPDAVWATLPEAARRAGPMPDLARWQALSRARAEGGRGPALLAMLRLLDGSAGEAAPLTLAAAVETLAGLGLQDDARSLAAGALRLAGA